MDILTHLLLGATATSPWWGTHPLEATAFALGSILPDIDALSRQFGRLAYLRAHQGTTHALPVQLLVGLSAGLLVAWCDLSILFPTIAACTLGAVLHSLLDWTNTYGVRLWAPFDRRRRALEWVFFIDAGVLVLTIPVCVAQAANAARGGTSFALAAVWFGLISVYFASRGALRMRARRFAPRADSLIPRASIPWMYDALERTETSATTYSVDALSGSVSDRASWSLLDHEWAGALSAVQEYRVMRALSAGYAVVAFADDVVECRDLRTRRTFGTNFGRLRVRFGSDGPRVEQFDV